MGKFSSEEIESQYNLIKMLLAEPEKYRELSKEELEELNVLLENSSKTYDYSEINKSN